MTDKSSFEDISPRPLRLNDNIESSSLTAWQGDLYLAFIEHDEESQLYLYRVLLLTGGEKTWITIYEDEREYEKDESLSGATSSRIAVITHPLNGEEALFVRLAAPIDTVLVRIIGGKVLPQEPGLASPIWLDKALTYSQILQWQDQLFGFDIDDKRSGSGFLVSGVDRLQQPIRELDVGNLLGAHNVAISDAVVFARTLYIATVNLETGFEVWKAKANGYTDPLWDKVIDNGGYRFSQNQQVFGMIEHDGSLYLAVGTTSEAQIPESKFIGYQGFELIRLTGSDQWDLLVGTPRFTPQGLAVPLSGRGPGLTKPLPARFVCLTTHRQHLILAAQDDEGFGLWVSRRGEDWICVEKAAFSDLFNVPQCSAVSLHGKLYILLQTDTIAGARNVSVWAGDIITL